MSLDSSVQNRFSLKVLSVAALTGLAVFGVGANSAVQAEDTTTITTTLPNGTEQTLELQTTYGVGDASVSRNYTVLGQEVPYTYKFDNLYGDTENGNTAVDTSVTVLGQPVTFTYKIPSDYTIATGRVTDISTTDVQDVLFQGLSGSDGGAIYNYAVDNSSIDIVGDFVGNDSSKTGGAIYNTGTTGKIAGNFIGNQVYSSSSNAQGGAIYNTDSINDGIANISNITGAFIGNYAKSETGTAFGGAIYNYAGANRQYAEIDNITGNFIGNYVISSNSVASGGAIYNYAGTKDETANISNITGNFIGNYAKSTKSNAWGGAIYNSGTIGKITRDFIGNYAKSINVSTYGGAICNYGSAKGLTVEISSITGDFIGNHIEASKDAQGGAIYNRKLYSESIAITRSITGDFIGNYAKSETGTAYGGAIYNNATIGSVDTEGNINGGLINTSFIGNYTKSETGTAQGGAIWTNTDLNIIAQDGFTSVISGNYVEDADGKRQEAIRVAYNGLASYVGDYTRSGTSNNYKYSVYKNSSPTTLSLLSNTNSKIIIDDQIVGTSAKYNSAYYYQPSIYQPPKYIEFNSDGTFSEVATPESVSKNQKLNITGDGTGLVQLNNDVIGMDVSLTNSTLHLGTRDNILNGNNLILNSGTFNMMNNQVGISSLNSLTLNETTDFVADVNLETPEMDRFVTNNNYTITDGANLNVIGMNIVKDMKEGVDTVEIMFTEQGLKDNVTYAGAEMPQDSYQNYEFYSPIYKYNAIYDKSRDNAGYFMFTKGDKIFVPTPDGGGSGGGSNTPTVVPNGNASNAFNPAVLGSSTGATVGALGTMNATMHYAFQNSENFMHIPYLERIAYRDRNKYALSPTGDATDVGTYSPLFTKNEYGSAWFKPYATFENVGLKNGPKVSNITYGTLVGFDTDLESIKGGWDRTFTGYIGYNGASQRYSGVDTYQNGGLIGGTVTLYKGNFFNATTLSVGASVANNSTMYGNDDYAMLLSGIGNKTGYNFEFKEGKVILQPSMLLSYTFVNTFDYTNAAGVRIDNKPLHALQLAPGVKLIGNTKNGWQPYLGVSMVWNLMGESDATANGVKLPQMSIKPYVQYGIGVQKRFKDHFMGFGQAMVQNGGRNGISLTAGFRWAIGKDKDQKVELKKQNGEIAKQVQNDKVSSASGKKILKQMKPEQKVALGGKNHSTRTVTSGMLKQL